MKWKLSTKFAVLCEILQFSHFFRFFSIYLQYLLVFLNIFTIVFFLFKLHSLYNQSAWVCMSEMMATFSCQIICTTALLLSCCCSSHSMLAVVFSISFISNYEFYRASYLFVFISLQFVHVRMLSIKFLLI